jgi:hypothetical protein
MKPLIIFSISITILVSCILFTALNLNSRFQAQKSLERRKYQLGELEEIYGSKTVTTDLNLIAAHDSNLRLLAQNYLAIHKTRSEKTAEYNNLFIEFSGDFQNSLNFLNTYLRYDYQYAIKAIDLKPLDNGSLYFELVLCDLLS